jgi:hypothetical protein
VTPYWQANYDLEQTQGEIWSVTSADNGNWSAGVGYTADWNASLQTHQLRIILQVYPGANLRKIRYTLNIQDISPGILYWSIARKRNTAAEGGNQDAGFKTIIDGEHTTTPDILTLEADIDREWSLQTSLLSIELFIFTEGVPENQIPTPFTVSAASLLGDGLPINDMTRRAANVQLFDVPQREWQPPG